MKLSEMNPQRKEIKIGDLSFELGEFNLNVMAAVEDKFKISIMSGGIETILQSISGFRFLLWRLIKAGKNTWNGTEEELGELIGIKELMELTPQIVKVFESAIPTDEQSKNSVDQPKE